MIESYTKSLFQSHLNEVFMIELENDEQLSLHLIDIKTLGSQHPEKSSNEAFALYFLDKDHPKSYLNQSTYRLKHAHFGILELFIVPMGPQAEGMMYEVIFT